MKLPKSFRPVKDLEENIECLLKEPDYNPKIVSYLWDSCEDFLENTTDLGFLKDRYYCYYYGEKLAQKIDYNKTELEILSQKITITKENDKWLGIYLSALVNKIINEDDEITLTPKYPLNGIGECHKKGRLIVQGNASDYTGFYMKGGRLVVEGNANDNTGYGMVGGELVVEGNANGFTGCCMSGGRLVVEGNANDDTGFGMVGGGLVVGGKINSISNDFRKGVIIEGGKVRRDC
ncbi:MAG: hypothetical protein KKA79_03160 [Nanoarchaeota archaeon]|nr:hypothetical protein [Nanoarchaeota archaeon]